MRTIWVAVIAVLLGLAAGASAAMPEMLPNLPAPAAGPNAGQGLLLPHTAGPSVGTPPATPPLVVGDGGPPEHGMPCQGCRPDAGGSCWHQLCAWFSYRPCLSTLHHLRVPYNPQPPLYLYFLYPPLVDGQGQAYHCCTPRHLLPESIRPAPGPVVFPGEPEVVVEH